MSDDDHLMEIIKSETPGFIEVSVVVNGKKFTLSARWPERRGFITKDDAFALLEDVFRNNLKVLEVS